MLAMGCCELNDGEGRANVTWLMPMLWDCACSPPCVPPADCMELDGAECDPCTPSVVQLLLSFVPGVGVGQLGCKGVDRLVCMGV